jgi:hypothetical protein
MKVYMVRRGAEGPDVSPYNVEVFDDRAKAVAYIMQDMSEDSIVHTERYPNGSWRSTYGNSRWEVYIRFDDEDTVELLDEVWLIEEWEVQ